MRRCRASWAVVVAGVVAAVGCKHTARYNTDVPLQEEFAEPPHEPRFDNAQEQGYQKPKAKKEFTPGPGGPGGPGGVPGGPGFGGGSMGSGGRSY